MSLSPLPPAKVIINDIPYVPDYIRKGANQNYSLHYNFYPEKIIANGVYFMPPHNLETVNFHLLINVTDSNSFQIDLVVPGMPLPIPKNPSWPRRFSPYSLQDRQTKKTDQIVLQSMPICIEIEDAAPPATVLIPDAVNFLYPPKSKTFSCLHCGGSIEPKRKGPQGPKTLCNPCGLQYSRSIKRLEKKTQSPKITRWQNQKFNFETPWNFRSANGSAFTKFKK